LKGVLLKGYFLSMIYLSDRTPDDPKNK